MNASGTPLKTFVVGANASGANNGEFIINDLGQAVGGAGARRMTITNAGEAHFTGMVLAPAFLQTSSLRYKSDVETLQDAIGLVNRLRGVRFVWKETGKPSLGLIAEEMAEAVPELVAINEQSGQAKAVNYAALTAVLIEAVKEQQEQIRLQQRRTEAQQAQIQSLQAELAEMQSLLNELLGEQGHRTQLVSAGDGR
ncbi:MAG TPA: tail fiber domain-containing protein [Acidobacteriota bacterium]|nr:tail fiber domain-containing protein [Acidobacteriota bacterium]